MTVTTDEYSQSFDGDDGTVAFPVTDFKILETTDIEVLLIKADGRQLVQTVTTEYSAALASSTLPSLFTVTMVTAPATGETLKVRLARETGKQNAAIPASGPLNTTNLENSGLDSLQLAINSRQFARAHYGGDQDGALVLDMGTIGTTYTLTAHEEKLPILRLTGSPGGAVTITYSGSTQQLVMVINETDEAVTIAPDGSPSQSITVATLKAATIFVDGPGSKAHRITADVASTS